MTQVAKARPANDTNALPFMLVCGSVASMKIRINKGFSYFGVLWFWYGCCPPKTVSTRR
jgi:hypothetical protein